MSSSTLPVSGLGTRGYTPAQGLDEFLVAHSMIGAFPEPERSALLRRSTPRKVNRGEAVFREGDLGATVIVVRQGFVKLSKPIDDGREVMLEIVGPGGCLGELAVLNKWSQGLDAIALSGCRLLAIDGREFKQALDRRPECMAIVMRAIGDRLRAVTSLLVDTVGLSARARLAKLVLHLGRLQSMSLHRGEPVRLHLSQSELGTMTGMSRESVNKLLGQWREQGWIVQANRSLILLDPAALGRLTRESRGRDGKAA